MLHLLRSNKINYGKSTFSHLDNMKKLIIAFCLILLSCNDEPQSDHFILAEARTPKYSPKELISQLEAGFKFYSDSKRLDSLKFFFDEWNKSILPNADSFVKQNDTLISVYAIFKKMYKPYNLSELGNWEIADSFNIGFPYCVIQNNIYFSVVPSDTLNNYSSLQGDIDTITDFRPQTGIEKYKILYLVPEYHVALDSFLAGANNLPKAEAIRNFIPLTHAHSGSYWHLGTFPLIETITLNRKLNEAIVRFQVRFQGGEAKLRNTNSDWEIVNAKSTWIQ